MSDSEAVDWLSVALGEVSGYPAHALDRACSEARRTCTHHAQIVPTIVKEADAVLTRDRSLAEASVITVIEPAKRLPAPALTQQDVDQLTPELVKIGLGCGALIRDADGNVRPAPTQPGEAE